MGAWQPQQERVFVLASEAAYGFGSAKYVRFQKWTFSLAGVTRLVVSERALMNCQQIFVLCGPVASSHVQSKFTLSILCHHFLRKLTLSLELILWSCHNYFSSSSHKELHIYKSQVLSKSIVSVVYLSPNLHLNVLSCATVTTLHKGTEKRDSFYCWS